MAVETATAAEERTERLAEQRRALPDQPGVYLFRDARGPRHLRRQGEVDHEARRLALLQPDARGSRALHDRGRPDRVPRRRRPRPRRCSPSRTSSSSTSRASTSGCATTSPIRSSRSRSTRTTRGSTSRASATAATASTSGPFSSAKRVRGTLDLLGKVFLFRSCEGAEPGRRSGSPCLDYYIKRCGAPCVGYVSQGGVPRGHRRRDRLPVGPLQARSSATSSSGCTSPPGEQDFEQATRRAQPAAGGALAARAPARRQRGRRDRSTRSRSPCRGRRPTPRSSRSATACSPTASPSTSTTRARPTSRARRRGVHPAVLRERAVDPGAASSCQGDVEEGSALDVLGEILVRAPRRARSRSAPPSAAASGGSSSSPSATRGSRSTRSKLKAERRRQQRVEALDGLQAALGLDALPVRIECFDISNLRRHATRSPRWSSSRAARRRSPTTGASRSATGRGRPDDFASMDEVLARRAAQFERQAREVAVRLRPRRLASPRCPTSSSSTAARASSRRASSRCRAFRERGVVGRLAGQAHRGGLRPRRPRRRCVLAHDTPGAPAPAARARRGAPLRDHPPPHPPRQGDDGVDHGRAARASARRASARCSSTSARPTTCSGATREELEAVPGAARRRWRATSTRTQPDGVLRRDRPDRSVRCTEDAGA